MTKRFVSVLLALMLLLVAAPALAVERVDTLPSFSAPVSGQLKLAVAIKLLSGSQESLILAYGNGRFSGDRLALTVVDAISGQQIDVLVIGNAVYVRAPGSDKWLVASPADAGIPVSSPTTTSMPADIKPTISRYETAESVEGVPTTHYQLWISASSLPAVTADMLKSAGIEAVTDDAFIGVADNLLRKTQSNIIGTDSQLGAYTIETPLVFTAINEPQTIEAPAPELIQTVVATSLSGAHVPGAKAMPAWQRPVVAWMLQNHK